MTLIFKIAGAAEWRDAEAAGVFTGAAVDRADGYIHFSTAPQAAETAAKWFAGRDDLVLAAVEAEALGPALRWETARGGALFPHLYGRCRSRRFAGRGRCRSAPTGATSSEVSRDDAGARRAGAAASAKLEPETAHRAAIAALRLAPSGGRRRDDPRLAVAAFGLAFANPLGMAAGFDKNAEVPGALLGAGFGFVEVGTLTPRAQPGNPAAAAVSPARATRRLVNRLGFNNDGFEAAHARLARGRRGGIVGVNIGANKDSTDRIADYVSGVKTFADVASYLTINVSSPNTPGLRELQRRGAFDELIARVIEARDACAVRRPVLVKIAPDLDLVALDDIVSVARARGVDGMIVSNTTIGRPPTLQDRRASEAADFPAGRCSICRRAPWRAPICAPRGPLRWSAAAASTARRPRWPRSRRGPASCSSTPRWSIAGRG